MSAKTATGKVQRARWKTTAAAPTAIAAIAATATSFAGCPRRSTNRAECHTSPATSTGAATKAIAAAR